MMNLHRSLNHTMPKNRRVVYFGDQASWHRGLIFRECDLSTMIAFNLPGLFMINYIEALFSIKRSKFRRRKFVIQKEDDIKSIVKFLETVP